MSGTACPSRRTTSALAVAVLGVYVLIMAGATTAVADAAATCSAWPTCDGRWLVPLDDGRLAIAWGHRVLALLVGGIVLAAAALGWRDAGRPRVKAALAAAVGLYPVQVALGAVTAVAGPTPLLSGLHLLVGMGIFGGLVLALAWTLEARSGDAERDPSSADTDPVSSPDVTGSGKANATMGPDATSTSSSSPNSSSSPPPSPSSTSSSISTGSSIAASRPPGQSSEPESGPANERDATSSAGPIDRIATTARAYLALTKPRLMWLLCLVAAAGMALAAGSALTLGTVVATLGGGVLAIGASGTFNHVLERDVDRRMRRTADRPLATDRVGVRNAIAFGVALTVASVAVFLSINRLAAALGLAAIAYYSVIYTLVLKPNTVRNTVVGGLAGSFPALIGAAAATNAIGAPALLLAAVIFLWTPAHFYNLALAYKDDYARGGFPMLPVVRGESTTRKHILGYLGATFLAAAALSAASGLGWPYALTAVGFGAAFLWAVVRLHHDPGRAAALRSFHASNAYLGALLLAIVVDALAL